MSYEKNEIAKFKLFLCFKRNIQLLLQWTKLNKYFHFSDQVYTDTGYDQLLDIVQMF
jgi:hypothetical protein